MNFASPCELHYGGVISLSKGVLEFGLVPISSLTDVSLAN